MANTQNEKLQVSLWPNPVKNVLNISGRETLTSVSLYDLQGRLLQVKTLNGNAATIDVSTYAAGSYLVKVMTVNGAKTVKVIRE